MATTTTYHAQLIKYTASGDQYILNLKNTGDDVSISRSSNGNLPTTVTSAQTLANALGSLAFKSSITASNIASGEITSSLNITAAGKIADASALKVLNDKITTNANNITKLNSNLDEVRDQSTTVTVKSTDWTGTASPYSCTISSSKILANSNVDISIASSATDAQALAYVAGAFIPSSINAGSIVVKAYGKKPKVDLTLALLIHGKEKA